MTPITERLAEALREARNDLNETAGSNSQYIAGLDKLLAEYDRLRTHPSEGGEGPLEMRLCETRFLSLRPNQPYLFTVDPNCPQCVECAASYAAPPQQPVAPEREIVPEPAYEKVARDMAGWGVKLKGPLSPQPERGEAKAVAPALAVVFATPQQLQEALVHFADGALEDWTETIAIADTEDGLIAYDPEYPEEGGITLDRDYATPQPPPAPRFRDPTIEDAMRFYDVHTSGDVPENMVEIYERVLTALKAGGFVVNAIGAKVGERT